MRECLLSCAPSHVSGRLAWLGTVHRLVKRTRALAREARVSDALAKNLLARSHGATDVVWSGIVDLNLSSLESG